MTKKPKYFMRDRSYKARHFRNWTKWRKRLAHVDFGNAIRWLDPKIVCLADRESVQQVLTM